LLATPVIELGNACTAAAYNDPDLAWDVLEVSDLIRIDMRVTVILNPANQNP